VIVSARFEKRIANRFGPGLSSQPILRDAMPMEREFSTGLIARVPKIPHDQNSLLHFPRAGNGHSDDASQPKESKRNGCWKVQGASSRESIRDPRTEKFLDSPWPESKYISCFDREALS
jgi:hypothetical protein